MKNDWGKPLPVEYCRGKVKYDKKSAVTASNRRYDEDHIKLRIYACQICRGWHLTSKPIIKYERVQTPISSDGADA
jgi:hypothetical protein